MNIKFYRKAVFRVPQFPYDATLEQCWDQLKDSIKLASEDFFKLIENTPYANYPELSHEIRLTIQKYFNRSRLRATPYGTFAAIGVCDIAKDPSIHTIFNERTVCSLPDWKHSETIDQHFLNIPPKQLILQANSSNYVIGEHIRYISKSKPGKFHLSDIPYHDIIAIVLDICTQPTTAYDLMHQLELDQQTCYSYVSELVEAQLLFTHRQPNIIGIDYFRRIGEHAKQGNQYVISTYETRYGGLQSHVPVDLLRAIPVLQQISPPPVLPDALQNFIQQFTAKYDQKAVPLLEALDPEIGIGYAELENIAEDQALVADLLIRKITQKTDNSAIIKDYLAANWYHASGSHVIILDQLPLMTSIKPLLPNTCSAMFSLYGDTIVLEHFGGASANALLGRFTTASESIHTMAKQLAQIEQEANPNTLFFDIAYLGDPGVDNINRRQQIYDYQLSILNYSTSSGNLQLNELMLMVKQGEIILYSTRHKKRVVPRIASAYNHTRSDLSVFRFLCDLQYQNLQSQLQFDLENLFPGHSYYPQVRYHKIILSLAKWKVRLLDLPAKATVEDLICYIEEKNISTNIKVGFGDQTLVLNTRVLEDMTILHSILCKHRQIWLTEIPSNAIPNIRNENNAGFRAEYIVPFYHTQEIYPLLPIEESYPYQIRKFHPGSEWLYWEIYCHPINADSILAEEISSFLNENAAYINSWFFIRYNEGGDHIRFRVKARELQYLGLLLSALHTCLSDKLHSGVIKDIVIKTYQPEVERYAVFGMENIEKHFWIDSVRVLRMLAASLNDQEKYALCIELLLKINTLQIIDFKKFIQHMADAYSIEHKLTGEEYKKLNAGYKAFQQWDNLQISRTLTLDDQFVQSYSVLATPKQSNKRKQLLADLFHMHINRLFSSDQRTHELIIYYYLNCILNQRDKKIERNALV